MYRTIKIRLKATKAQKEHLFTYEAEYHQQLVSLVAQMRTHPYNVKFKDISIAESIAVHSRWTLYQLALKMHNREKEQKRTGYGKSSTWSPRSFTINKDRLTLHYGKQFSHRKDTVTLKPLATELLQLEEHEIIRMDLVHDEYFWYANFLVRICVNT